jgi:hypothetical protein
VLCFHCPSFQLLFCVSFQCTELKRFFEGENAHSLILQIHTNIRTKRCSFYIHVT